MPDEEEHRLVLQMLPGFLERLHLRLDALEGWQAAINQRMSTLEGQQ